MFKFFLKKNFADGWDNLFFLILTNVLSIALLFGSYFLLSFSAKINHFLQIPALIAIFCVLSTVFFAHGAVSAKIANFDSGDIGTFFRAFVYVWRVSVPFGALAAVSFVLLRFGILYYISIGGTIGTLAAGLLIWFSLGVLIAMEWFAPLFFLQQGNGFAKCLKKSFIIFFDNPMFSIGVFIYNILLFVLSVVIFMLIPGFAGISLSSMNALRLRLYKYDWLEEHPEIQNDREKRSEVPWNELLADDIESLGPRKLSSFIFPWK